MSKTKYNSTLSVDIQDLPITPIGMKTSGRINNFLTPDIQKYNKLSLKKKRLVNYDVDIVDVRINSNICKKSLPNSRSPRMKAATTDGCNYFKLLKVHDKENVDTDSNFSGNNFNKQYSPEPSNSNTSTSVGNNRHLQSSGKFLHMVYSIKSVTPQKKIIKKYNELDFQNKNCAMPKVFNSKSCSGNADLKEANKIILNGDSIFTDIDDGSFFELVASDTEKSKSSDVYYTCDSKSDTVFSTSSKKHTTDVGFHKFVEKMKLLNINYDKPPCLYKNDAFTMPVADSCLKYKQYASPKTCDINVILESSSSESENSDNKCESKDVSLVESKGKSCVLNNKEATEKEKNTVGNFHCKGNNLNLIDSPVENWIVQSPFTDASFDNSFLFQEKSYSISAGENTEVCIIDSTNSNLSKTPVPVQQKSDYTIGRNADVRVSTLEEKIGDSLLAHICRKSNKSSNLENCLPKLFRNTDNNTEPIPKTICEKARGIEKTAGYSQTIQLLGSGENANAFNTLLSEDMKLYLTEDSIVQPNQNCNLENVNKCNVLENFNFISSVTDKAVLCKTKVRALKDNVNMGYAEINSNQKTIGFKKSSRKDIYNDIIEIDRRTKLTDRDIIKSQPDKIYTPTWRYRANAKLNNAPHNCIELVDFTSSDEDCQTDVHFNHKNSCDKVNQNSNMKKLLERNSKQTVDVASKSDSSDDDGLNNYIQKWNKKKSCTQSKLHDTDVINFITDDESDVDCNFYLPSLISPKSTPLKDFKAQKISNLQTYLSSKKTINAEIEKPKNIISKNNFEAAVNVELSNEQNLCASPLLASYCRSNVYISFLSSLSLDKDNLRIHPDAVVYVKNFKRNKDALVEKLYKLFNYSVFDGKLPHILNIKWNPRLTKTAGYCYYKINRSEKTGRGARIELSSKVIDSCERLRDTLIHELCHAAAWIISGYKDGHGRLWKTWAAKAMKAHPELPPILRCHSYEVSCKYTYKCTNCGYSIGRHSKSLDIEKKVCGLCYGKFLLIVNTKSPDSLTPNPRRPGAFALYIKDNYRMVKSTNSHLRHADIMKLLSNEFSKMKAV